MDREQQSALLGAMLQQPPTSHPRFRWQLAKARIPLRRVNLQWMVNGVTAKNRIFTFVM